MSWDAALFHVLNRQWTHSWLDAAMPVVTNSATWRVPTIALLLVLLWRGTPRVRWILLGIGLCVGLSDQLSSHLLKPLIGRPRPSFTLPDVRLLLSPKYSFSFPSSHAVNLGAAAWFVLRAGAPRLLLGVAFAIVAVVCYSRIYVGVHYPSDVLFGAMIGALVAECVVRWPPLRRRVLRTPSTEPAQPSVSGETPVPVAYRDAELR